MSNANKSETQFSSLYHQLAQPKYDAAFLVILLLFETVLTTQIVKRVPYTEIDWVAYMQEVTTYQEGERDYVNIRGDTGPLVYPAGFLYLYGWFKSLAVGKSDEEVQDPLGLSGSTYPQAIRKVQWMFVILYLLNCAVVLGLYQKVLHRMRLQHEKQNGKSSLIVWYWRIAMGIACLSKRIHSIFVLRLFNDAPSMFLLHVSMYLFTFSENNLLWMLGCAAFSLAVSIKMNVLLFAPGLLLLMLQKNQCLIGTIGNLSICASIQLILGWPFLSTFPISYIKKAFEFDRVFFFKWTVNWKFLPEDMFVSKQWALVLLACHLGTLVLLAKKWWRASVSQRGTLKTREWMCLTKKSNSDSHHGLHLTPEYIICTMFVTNYIGIAFARTLHYQFYSWYFYSLPMLHWMSTMKESSSVTALGLIFSMAFSVGSIFAVEYAFNVFPATSWSSTVLQISHAVLLLRIFLSEVPVISTGNGEVEMKKER